MGFKEIMKILVSSVMPLHSYIVQTKLFGMVVEVYIPTPEHEHGEEHVYRRYIDGSFVQFTLLTLGERRVLKNFIIEQSVEFKKKKWYQFWISNSIEETAQRFSLTKNDGQKFIMEKLEKLGNELFVNARKV